MTVTTDTTRDELAEAIGHLRFRQMECQLAEMRAEIGVEIDLLLDAYMRAPS